MSTARWYAHLQSEVASLGRIAPGDVAAQEQGGRAAIALWSDPARRARVLSRFADNPEVVALGSEFIQIMRSAASAPVL